jgi:23S rRNA (cytosine1962-C5)-methyltransferase
VERVKIVLKSGKEQSLLRLHPWVFSGAIKKMYGNPAEGDLVDVYDNKDTFLATGHYAPSSISERKLRKQSATERPSV